MTPEMFHTRGLDDLIADNTRLRARIKEVQDRADREKGDLLKRIAELEMRLSVVNGVVKIGQDFFWDIAKCAARPLRLSISDASVLGSRILMSVLHEGEVENVEG
jgi:hypothetical protein